MDEKEKFINKINLHSHLQKLEYLESLKKEYLQLEEKYNIAKREYQRILIINFVKRREAKAKAKDIRVRMLDLSQRIAMIEEI